MYSENVHEDKTSKTEQKKRRNFKFNRKLLYERTTCLTSITFVTLFYNDHKFFLNEIQHKFAFFAIIKSRFTASFEFCATYYQEKNFGKILGFRFSAC